MVRRNITRDELQQMAHDLYMAVNPDMTPTFTQVAILKEIHKKTSRTVSKATLWRWIKGNCWEQKREALQRQVLRATEPMATVKVVEPETLQQEAAKVGKSPTDVRDVVIQHVSDYVKHVRGLTLVSLKTLADDLKRHMEASQRLKDIDAMPKPQSREEAERRDAERKSLQAMMLPPKIRIDIAKLGQVIQAGQLAMVMGDDPAKASGEGSDESEDGTSASVISFLKEARTRGTLQISTEKSKA